ncbi:MAG: hypothetical protein Ta2A_24790 [Treponemataceae bacterium]|nr:MAG: hypothetical protein Ta2A_24790 [Treponemataceae bacterium]
MSKTDVMNVLEKAPESVLDEVYNYALFLIARSDASVQRLPKTSRSDIVKSLRGSIKHTGTADDIRAERLSFA